MRIVGGGFVFALWFLLLALHLGEDDEIKFGVIGVAGMVAIVLGRNFESKNERISSVVKAIVYSISAVLFGIVGAFSWSLYQNDVIGIIMSLVSTAVAIISAFVFIDGIELIRQLQKRRNPIN